MLKRQWGHWLGSALIIHGFNLFVALVSECCIGSWVAYRKWNEASCSLLLLKTHNMTKHNLNLKLIASHRQHQHLTSSFPSLLFLLLFWSEFGMQANPNLTHTIMTLTMTKLNWVWVALGRIESERKQEQQRVNFHFIQRPVPVSAPVVILVWKRKDPARRSYNIS